MVSVKRISPVNESRCWEGNQTSPRSSCRNWELLESRVD